MVKAGFRAEPADGDDEGGRDRLVAGPSTRLRPGRPEGCLRSAWLALCCNLIGAARAAFYPSIALTADAVHADLWEPYVEQA